MPLAPASSSPLPDAFTAQMSAKQRRSQILLGAACPPRRSCPTPVHLPKAQSEAMGQISAHALQLLSKRHLCSSALISPLGLILSVSKAEH